MITISPTQKHYIDSAILDTYHSLTEGEQIALDKSEDGGDAQIVELRLLNFRRLSTSEELHYLMKHWNWDDGIEIPKLVIEHPRCDRGTALMIYWMMDPDYYSKYTSEDDVDDYQRDDYRFLKELEKKLLNHEFTTAIIKFTPSTYASSQEIANPAIKDELKVESDGEEFDNLIAFA